MTCYEYSDKDINNEILEAIENSIASLEMEGFKITSEDINEIAKKLNNDQIKKLISKRRRENGKR